MRKTIIVTHSLNISLVSDSTSNTVLSYLSYIASVVFLMHYNYAHCKYIHKLSFVFVKVVLCLSKLFCAQMYKIYLRYVVILVILTLLSVNTVRPFSVILAYDHCSIKNKHLNTNFQQQLRDKV